MKATLIVTDLQKGIFWEQREAREAPLDAVHQVSIYPDIRGQMFHGFGGAFTEAAAYNYQKLSSEKRREFMALYFGDAGLRYTQGRVHIGSCDFALGNYSCRESEADDFDTSRDEQYLIPMVEDAQAAAGKRISLMLSPWSPPAFMKSNGDRNHGGKLLPEYAGLWAEYIAEYISYYRSRGLEVARVTIQNEPAAVQTWDSCIFTAEEEGHFAAEYLKPALKKADCGDVKIFAWDHNKEILPYRAAGTLSVPGAMDAVDGFGVHWYTGDHFDALSLTRQKYPDKELWFTEGCVEYSRFDGSSNVQKAEMYAHDILGNLNGGISGSLDWNLMVDSKGGPNHAGNFCEAPIMLRENEAEFEIRGEYYYIGHFSRYIQAGAVRLGTSVYGKVEATAFQNPDGTIAAVLLNPTQEGQTLSLTLDGLTGITVSMDAHTIATVQLDVGTV